MRFLGYPVEGFKLFVFTLTAVIAGLAGALYYPQAGIINPAEVAPIASVYLAVWVAIGGRGRLYGAVIGAAFVSPRVKLVHRRARARRAAWLLHHQVGRLVAGPAGPVLRRRHHPRTQGHRRAVRPVGRACARPTARVRRLAPTTVRCKRRRRWNDRTLLEVSGVSVTFDGFRAINNLSFDIGPAEMRAIIGPNGAGKTTFMDIVTGKTRPDEGRVLWGERSHLAVAACPKARSRRPGSAASSSARPCSRIRLVSENLMMAVQAPAQPGGRAVLPPLRRGSRPRRGTCRRNRAGRPACTARRASSATGRSNGWRSGCCWRRNRKLLLVDEPAAGMTLAEREHTTRAAGRGGEDPRGGGGGA